MNTLAKADPSSCIRDAVPADARRIAEIYAYYVGTSAATFEETRRMQWRSPHGSTGYRPSACHGE